MCARSAIFIFVGSIRADAPVLVMTLIFLFLHSLIKNDLAVKLSSNPDYIMDAIDKDRKSVV